MKSRAPYLCVLLLILAASTLLISAAPPHYQLINKYTLGGEGFWDYLVVDSAARRVYITRGTHVMVVDADSGKPVGDIPDTPGVHGVALVQDLGKGFTSDGQKNTVTMFDMKTLKPTGNVEVGNGPDAIVYDPASKRVFTMNGRGHDTTAIDAASGKVAGTLPLKGKPEFAQADGTGHVFVNIEDTSELVMFDSKNLKEMARWKLAPCEEPTGLALDNKHHRLFVGCGGNKMMAVVDATSGKVITTLPAGGGIDATGFDPGTMLAFATGGGGNGTLTVVHEDSPEKFTVVENVDTAPRARTLALDPKTHYVYTVTAQFGPAPQPTAENPRPRPPLVPGSFEMLVFGPK